MTRSSKLLPELFSIQEVADALGVHPRTVRRRIKNEEIRAIKLSPQQVRIAKEDLLSYLAMRRR